MNPVDSIAAWMRAAGHGAGHTHLYAGLVAEEAGELMRELVMSSPPPDDLVERATAGVEVDGDQPGQLLGIALRVLSLHARAGGLERLQSPVLALDAALDLAWVSLCLARTLAGDRLPEAWAELHRSNITDKLQPDGTLHRDSTGKVIKPAGWTPPDFAQFLRHGSEA